MMKRAFSVLLCLAIFITASLTAYADSEPQIDLDYQFGEPRSYRHIDTSDMCSVLLDHPAFEEFGFSILPPNFAGGSKETMAQRSIQDTLVKLKWDKAVDPIMNSLNELIDKYNQNEQVFFSYYSEEEILEDPTKAQTGIVFFKGDPDAPFVVITAGGGYDWYTGMAEGYPIAYEFQQRGYNALVLIYRVKMAGLSDYTNKIRFAMEDYDAAMRFIFSHIGEGDYFPLNRETYAVCGFSAGARLASLWGGDADRSWFALGMPKPQAMLLIYGGNLPESYGPFDYNYEQCPPAYALTCKDDKTRPCEEIIEMISFYDAAGIETQIDIRETGGHGFGLGMGTDAEGWFENAVAFWENHQ